MYCLNTHSLLLEVFYYFEGELHFCLTWGHCWLMMRRKVVIVVVIILIDIACLLKCICDGDETRRFPIRSFHSWSPAPDISCSTTRVLSSGSGANLNHMWMEPFACHLARLRSNSESTHYRYFPWVRMRHVSLRRDRRRVQTTVPLPLCM